MPKTSLKDTDNNLYLSKKFENYAPTREIVVAYRENYFREGVINELIQTIHQLDMINSF